MQKTVYVIGHKNPDTDSVVAATAYAALKRALGMGEARAARAGAANPQTEYIFERFKVPLPEFVPDLIPKVEYWMNGGGMTVPATTPLWEALALMGKAERKALPIVDEKGRYVSLLHYGAFAESILQKINPHKKAIIPTSVGHILKTSKAQPLVVHDPDTVFRGRLTVAALATETFRAYMQAEPASNKIVLVGDRDEVTRIAIESGCRVVVTTNGVVPGKELRDLAERSKVSLLVSPYDTSSTALLLIYSTPVGSMADETVKPVLRTDWVKSVRKALAESPSRSLPVVDDEGTAVGLFAEGDLARDPNVELILVDHNELTQAVEGAENYRILEVVDHHRLGVFSTKYPITFINRVVGSTSTIVANMYREARQPMAREIASILLCGILSDTLILRSATTTEVDRETAEYLSNITDLPIEQTGMDIMGTASAVAKRPAKEIINLDRKEYAAADRTMSVSQVEVTDTAEIMERKGEILAGLAATRGEKGHCLAALMVTDITELTSLLFIDAERDIIHNLGYPRLESGVYVLKDVLSRKKQLMPALSEIVEKALEK